MTAVSSAFASVMASPESARASLVATRANWTQRSRRRDSLAPKWSLASNPFTSAAKWVSMSDESNWVIGPTPERPAIRLCQVAGALLPSGLTAPTPVITTLFGNILGENNTGFRLEIQAGRNPPLSDAGRACNWREPMTFSQREKVPMQRPREAWVLHRRLRGAITRSDVDSAETSRGIGPGFALSGLDLDWGVATQGVALGYPLRPRWGRPALAQNSQLLPSHRAGFSAPPHPRGSSAQRLTRAPSPAGRRYWARAGL